MQEHRRNHQCLSLWWNRKGLSLPIGNDANDNRAARGLVSHFARARRIMTRNLAVFFLCAAQSTFRWIERREKEANKRTRPKKSASPAAHQSDRTAENTTISPRDNGALSLSLSRIVRRTTNSSTRGNCGERTRRAKPSLLRAGDGL